MKNPFGPWATSIDAGCGPQLSTFWRQRMTKLVSDEPDQSGAVAARDAFDGLGAAGVLMRLLARRLRRLPVLGRQDRRADPSCLAETARGAQRGLETYARGRRSRRESPPDGIVSRSTRQDGARRRSRRGQ